MPEIPSWLNQPSPIPGYLSGVNIGTEIALKQQQLAQAAQQQAQSLAAQRNIAEMEHWRRMSEAEVERQYRQQDLALKQQQLGVAAQEATARLQSEMRQSAAAEAMVKLNSAKLEKEYSPTEAKELTFGGQKFVQVFNPRTGEQHLTQIKDDPVERLPDAKKMKIRALMDFYKARSAEAATEDFPALQKQFDADYENIILGNDAGGAQKLKPGGVVVPITKGPRAGHNIRYVGSGDPKTDKNKDSWIGDWDPRY